MASCDWSSDVCSSDLFECLGPCQEDSCPKTHPISTVSRIKPREILHRRHFFHTLCFLHYSKVRLPKYCRKRALQGREKSCDMSTYRVPKCGRHFVKFDDVTIYPVLVVARTETRISLRWLTYIVNSVDKTKLSCNTPTDAAPQFL